MIPDQLWGPPQPRVAKSMKGVKDVVVEGVGDRSWYSTAEITQQIR